MTNTLKIGEVAKQTGLTIRALRFYDEKGLVVPTGRSEAGYRLYTAKDLLKLQYVQSLQSLGLSLAEIKNLIQADTQAIVDTFHQQLKKLDETIQIHQQLQRRLTVLLDELSHNEEPTLDNILATLKVTIMFEKYFTQTQLAELEARKPSPEDHAAYGKAWQDIFSGMDKCFNQGLQPDDAQVQVFAKQAVDLVKAFTNNDPALEASLNKMYQSEDGFKMLSSQGYNIDRALYDFLNQAMEVARQ